MTSAPTWIVPPRGGRPFVAADTPVVSLGDRWLALALDRKRLVTWRGAGEDLHHLDLPGGLEVRGVVLGEDRIAALHAEGAAIWANDAWSRYECQRPRHGAFGADGALRLVVAGSLRCVEADGTLRWSQPCDFEQPLVAVGDEVWLVDWGVTVIASADGTLREVDNGAEAPPAGAVKVGDAVVAVTVSDDGQRAMLVMRGDAEEVVALPQGRRAGPLAGVGDRGVLIGTTFFPLDGEPLEHEHATVSAYPVDGVASDGTHLWALRGGAISTWRLGEEAELGVAGLAHPISWDVAADGRVVVAVPNEVVLIEPSGHVYARTPVPLVSQVRFSRDGQRVIATNLEGAPGVRTLDAATGAPLAVHAGPIAKPQRLAVLEDATVVVSEGFTLHLLGPDLVAYGACHARPNDYASAMDQLVAAGPWLVGLDTQRTLHIFRLPERAERKAVKPAHTVSRNVFGGSSIALHGDEVVACGDAAARWSLETGKKLKAAVSAELAGRGRPIVWHDGVVHALDTGTTWPCPARPSAIVAAGEAVYVELCEGIARL